MPITYTTFAVLVRGATVITLNVVSWEENATVWANGGSGRAQDGTYLTTERNPKYSARATIEFWTAAEYEALRALVSAGVDPVTGRLTGRQPVALGGVGVNGVFRRSTSIQVFIGLGQARPWFREEAGVLVTGWTVDIEVEEA